MAPPRIHTCIPDEYNGYCCIDERFHPASVQHGSLKQKNESVKLRLSSEHVYSAKWENFSDNCIFMVFIREISVVTVVVISHNQSI